MRQNKFVSILIVYTKPISFSGQSFASELLIDIFKNKKIKFKTITFNQIDRINKNIIINFLSLITNTVLNTLKIWKLIINRNHIVNYNIGQSLTSFIRVGPSLFILGLLKRNKIIISLHGAKFFNWQKNSIIYIIFKFLLMNADLITVLSNRQHLKLKSMGVEERKISLVNNTCDIDPIDESTLLKKLIDRHINILHLSLLIESKGFPIFLNVGALLSRHDRTNQVKGVLCGPLSTTAECRSFVNDQEKSSFIESKIKTINKSNNVKFQWIDGAYGDKKAKLYEECSIFIFPSTFSVEAQPIVIIEAMASGCAIITSKVGEIPELLDENCAILLDDLSPKSIFNATQELITNKELREKLSRNARTRFNEKYSKNVYKNKWLEIINEIT
jgi:glycosyltransferase involved in cell wall biosynthesis